MPMSSQFAPFWRALRSQRRLETTLTIAECEEKILEATSRPGMWGELSRARKVTGSVSNSGFVLTRPATSLVSLHNVALEGAFFRTSNLTQVSCIVGLSRSQIARLAIFQALLLYTISMILSSFRFVFSREVQGVDVAIVALQLSVLLGIMFLLLYSAIRSARRDGEYLLNFLIEILRGAEKPATAGLVRRGRLA